MTTKTDRHDISASTAMEDTIAWLKSYGYIGVIAGGVNQGVALLFGRPGEPARIATVGNALVYWKHLDHVEVERG